MYMQYMPTRTPRLFSFRCSYCPQGVFYTRDTSGRLVTIITRTLLLDFLYLLEVSLLLLTMLITCISFWLLSFTCRLFSCNVRDNASSSVTVNRLSLRIILTIRFSLFCSALAVHSHAIVNTENLNGRLLSSFDIMAASETVSPASTSFLQIVSNFSICVATGSLSFMRNS